MKKFALCLMMLSLGLFSVGCSETTTTEPAAPVDEPAAEAPAEDPAMAPAEEPAAEEPAADAPAEEPAAN